MSLDLPYIFHQYAQPILLALLLLVAIIALIALASFLRRTTKVVKETKEKLDPILDQANSLLAEVQPAIERVDPLLERVTLTVDAANLEILRLDQIMSDLGDVSSTLGTTAKKIDAVTESPKNLANAVLGRVKDSLGDGSGSKASKEEKRERKALADAGYVEAEENVGLDLGEEAEEDAALADGQVDGFPEDDDEIQVLSDPGAESPESLESLSDEDDEEYDGKTANPGYFSYSD